jgi:hypothetical protein
MSASGDRALKDLAALMKARENQPGIGIITGTVVADPPNIEIKIFGNIILRKENLIFGSLVMPDEKRNFEIIAGTKDSAGASEGADELSKITLDTDDGTFAGTTNKSATGTQYGNPAPAVPPIPPVAAPFIGAFTGVASPPSATCSIPLTIDDPTHDHTLKDWSVANNKFTGKGAIKFKNTMKKNDEMILIPTADAGTFFVLDWARRIA